MKDKLLQIRADTELLSMIEYLRKINGYKSASDTVRETIEKEWMKEHEDVDTVKRGRWKLVTDNRGQHFVCTHCGEWKYHQDQRYCGNCGAYMG